MSGLSDRSRRLITLDSRLRDKSRLTEGNTKTQRTEEGNGVRGMGYDTAKTKLCTLPGHFGGQGRDGSQTVVTRVELQHQGENQTEVNNSHKKGAFHARFPYLAQCLVFG